MMDVAEARIAAHVCGDGCLSEWIEKNALQIVKGKRYYRARKRYEIVYSNNDPRLLSEFAEDIARVFKVKPRLMADEVRTRSKRVYQRIKDLGGNSTYRWSINRAILGAPKKIIIAWLRAFFDDEATVEKNTGRIRIKSMNKKGLYSTRKLLRRLKIKAQLTGPNGDKSWYLTISKAEAKKYVKLIGSNHSKKRKLMEN